MHFQPGTNYWRLIFKWKIEVCFRGTVLPFATTESPHLLGIDISFHPDRSHHIPNDGSRDEIAHRARFPAGSHVYTPFGIPGPLLLIGRT